jgi:hypothetical protein
MFDLGAFDHHIFGEKNFNVTGAILSFQIINSCMSLVATSRGLKSGKLDAEINDAEKPASDGFQDASNAKKGPKVSITTGLMWFFKLANYDGMAVLFIQNGFMKDENVMAKYWT